MKNYVKQMCRTPLQILLMIVLVMIVTVMLVVGGNLWVISDRLSKAYEDDFITIGTVTQKPDAVVEVEEWDAERKDYLFYKRGRYNRYVTPQGAVGSGERGGDFVDAEFCVYTLDNICYTYSVILK